MMMYHIVLTEELSTVQDLYGLFEGNVPCKPRLACLPVGWGSSISPNPFMKERDELWAFRKVGGKKIREGPTKKK